MNHVEPAVHEAKTYLHYRDYDLSPYWTLRNLVIHELDGYTRQEIEIGSETWTAELTYSDSGIAPRESDSVERDVLRDWELQLDGPGTEEKVHYHIRARFDEMKNPEGDEVSIPWKGGEGLDVMAQSANIDLDDLPYLLAESIQSLADEEEMDINPRYFRTPRPSSKIVTVEYYVRICRDHSMNLVEQDGILFRIMNLLAGQEGTSWTYKADNEEIVGHRHAMDLEPGDVNKLGPFSAGVRLKCYHPKHVRDEETEDDPLSSPKYGIAFHKSIDGNARKWDDRETLRRQIEELLINSMKWAGIDVEPDPLVFVSDDHFSAEKPSPVEITRRSDPTPQIEAEQETLLMSVIGELSPAGRDMTKEIATDGGRDYRQLAERTDQSVSTIYRVLDEMKGILESDRGFVDFTSDKIREEIVGMVERLDQLKNDTADRVAELANVELRSQASSAFEKWAAKYGAELVDYDDSEGTIRIDTVLTHFKSFHEPHVENVILEGKEAWKSTGRKGSTFERFDVEADLLEGGSLAKTVEKIIR